jgi:hypothetical protein
MVEHMERTVLQYATQREIFNNSLSEARRKVEKVSGTMTSVSYLLK